MRKRNRRKTRSLTPLNIHDLYMNGLCPNLFNSIDAYMPDDIDFEIQFCQEILRANDAHFEALTLLGDSYTRKGEFQKGLELDIRLSRNCPENKLVHYNLACSYALTGQKEKALQALTQAIELGYRDVEHLCQDHDLDAIKSDPRFKTLLASLFSQKRAVKKTKNHK